MESLPDIHEDAELKLTTKKVGIGKSCKASLRAISTSYFKHHKASVECLEEGARRWKRERDIKLGSKIKTFLWEAVQIIILAIWIVAFLIGLCKLFLDFLDESENSRDRKVVRLKVYFVSSISYLSSIII